MNAIVNQPVQESEAGARIRRNKAGQIMPGCGGRPKGVPNKTTRTLKQAILEAARQAGDGLAPNGGVVAYLRHVAETEPRVFVPLLGRVLPLEVHATAASLHIEARYQLTDAELEQIARGRAIDGAVYGGDALTEPQGVAEPAGNPTPQGHPREVLTAPHSASEGMDGQEGDHGGGSEPSDPAATADTNNQ